MAARARRAVPERSGMLIPMGVPHAILARSTATIQASGN
jgi:hypothetical protein